MASFRVLVQPAGAGVPIKAETSEMDIGFKSILLGEDELAIEQEGSGLTARLKTPARLVAAEAINSDEVVTKGQLDTAPRFKVEYHAVTGDDLDAGGFDLMFEPTFPEEVVLDLISGVPQAYGDDFTVTGKFLAWNDPSLGSFLEVGFKFRIQYLYTPV